MNAKPVVLIDGHTRQLAPLLIKPPSRLAPLFFLPRLLVIVLNLSLPPGRTTLPWQFKFGEKKPQAVRVTDSAGLLTFIRLYKRVFTGISLFAFLTTNSLKHLRVFDTLIPTTVHDESNNF